MVGISLFISAFFFVILGFLKTMIDKQILNYGKYRLE